MWANNFAKCIVCGKNDFPHKAQGLCSKCYEKYQYRKYNPHMYLPSKHKNINLTKNYLIQEYITNKKSLADIAREYGCTRQFIFKKLKEIGISARKKKDARFLALENNKIHCTHIDRDGNVKQITHQKSEIDEYFFSYWSEPMAWVLGFIYADGYLYPGTGFEGRYITKQFQEPRLTISQKEPEVLVKIKVLMKSNQKLSFSKRRELNNTVAGECYHLNIRSKQIFSDLSKIGLTPNKSLTMTFPDVPHEYIWHFIRGLWDGDGCLSNEKATGKINAGYVSGSKDFIEKFVQILKRELSLEKISIFHRGNSYEFKLHTNKCLKLCHHFYDGVSPDLYLSRKYNVYYEFMQKNSKANNLF